jgi:serine/threonine protein kinase/formylglycine-generating enzyme required for sulfatase activity
MARNLAELEVGITRWLKSEFQRAGIAGSDPGALRRHLERALDPRTIAANELEEGVDATLPNRSAAARLLEQRIERAVQATIAEASGLAQATLMRGPPLVVIADAEIDAGRTLNHRIEQRLELARDSALSAPPTLRAGDRGLNPAVIVIGASAATQTLAAARVETRTLEDGGLRSIDCDGVEDVIKSFEERLTELRPAKAAGGSAARPTPTVKADENDELLGTTLGGEYVLEKCLGAGGFGRVYKARHAQFGHRVAIKILLARHRQAKGQLDEFLEEYRRLVQIKHENIIEWKHFGRTDEGDPFIVMELLEGEELDATLAREGRLNSKRTGRILVQVLRALARAHFISEHEGILHLDLKPKNVFLVRDSDAQADRVKVFDFGVGQVVRRKGAADGGEDAKQELAGLTLDFASPEQLSFIVPGAKRARLEWDSDLYALGVMGYLMLTGEYPFDRRAQLPPPGVDPESFVEPPLVSKARARMVLESTKLDYKKHKVPRELAQFIDRCLAKDRRAQFTDSRAALAELEQIVAPQRLRRLLTIGAAVLVVAVGSAIGITRWLTPPSLEPMQLARGGRQLVANEDLFLSPSRTELRLDSDRLKAQTQAAVRLLDASSGRELTEHFTASAPEAGRLLVAAQPDALATRTRVRVEQGQHTSDSLFLWYLPPDAWALSRPEVTGWDGTRWIDPEGAELTCELQSEIGIVNSAVLAELALVARRADAPEVAPERVLPIALPTRPGRTLSVGLATLGLEQGTWSLGLRATDLAGNPPKDGPSLVVSLAPGKVAARADFAGARPGEPALLLLGQPAYVELELDRPTKVLLSARAEGKTLFEESLEFAAGKHVHTLATLALPEGRDRLEGQVQVDVDDNSQVWRRAGARAAERLPQAAFQLWRDRIELTPRLVAADAARTQLIEHGGVLFTPHRELRLELDRSTSHPLSISAALSPARDEAGAPKALLLPDGRARNENQIVHRFQLPGDGAYRLNLTARFHLGETKGDLVKPEWTRHFDLVLDQSPPQLSWASEMRDDLVLDARDQLERVPWNFRADDVSTSNSPATATVSGAPPPMKLDWQLLGPDGAATHTGEQSSPGNAPIALTLPPLTDQAPDGNYKLRVVARDFAGNASEPLIGHFELAAAGPNVLWDWSDRGVGEWRRWDVSVIVTDPNGVDAVSARVQSAGAATLLREVELVAGTGERWSANVDFDPRWSGLAVDVTVSARDRRGRTSDLKIKRTLAKIDAVENPIVRVLQPSPVGEMRLVRGNTGDPSPYAFHGRADRTENEQFTRDGIAYRFQANAQSPTPRAWQIEFEPGEIPSFYLDRDEVSVAEYLAFVHAADGYAVPRHWRASTPDSARRADLATRLEASVRAGDGDRPVRSVNWHEADAYATWVGKRLPSLLELEYATRGGSAYRSWSGAATDLKLADQVHFGQRNAGPLPRESATGDVTPGGIRALSGNVREWTATPRDTELWRFSRRNEPAFRALVQYPWSESAHGKALFYFAIGGSFATDHADFHLASTPRVTAAEDDLGFRCAADLASAEAAVELGRFSFAR